MSRESSLQRELEHLKALNSSVDELLKSTKIVSEGVSTSKKATDTSSALLGDWIKILNQTRFAFSALSNPEWKGATDVDQNEQYEAEVLEITRLREELRKSEAEGERLEQSLNAEPTPKRTAKRVRR